MRICGFHGVSAIDFPGRIASVLFLGGCNFRCPFCHNPDLVLRPDTVTAIEPDEILAAIGRRRRLIDGVVVTGGEPLVNSDELLPLLYRLCAAGLAVKLDTNGYEVDALRSVLASGLVDYVAMDVKTSLAKYDEASGRKVEPDRIREAVTTLQESSVDHEFRTTCVPGIVQLDDVTSIALLLGRNARYVLQQFRVSAEIIDPHYAGVAPYPAATLMSFADAVRPLVGSVTLRGV